MLPDLSRLAEDIQGSDPRDVHAQGALAGRLGVLCQELQRARAEDLAAYVDSARRLVAEIAAGNALGPAEVLDFAAELVLHVQQAFQGDVHPSVGAALPAPIPERAGDESTHGDQLDVLAGRIDLSRVDERMLGEIMLQLGFVTRAQLEQGLVTQRATDQRIGESLVAIGAATWSQVREAIAVQERLRRSSGRSGLRMK